MDVDKLKDVTSEALMISMIKMLVFQKLKNMSNGVDATTLKDKINAKSNSFYKPSESDIATQNNFNVFIENLSKKVLNYTNY